MATTIHSRVVTIGDNPEAGVKLILQLLGNRTLQGVLASLNVRLDEDTIQSLAYIVTAVKPELLPATGLTVEVFSYQPLETQ